MCIEIQKPFILEMLMKKFSCIATVAVCLMSGAAFAQSNVGSFNVVINLTAKCEVNSASVGPATISDLTMNYTSFQTTAATGSTNFNVRCTNGLPYGITLSTPTATDDALNLNYTLNLTSSATHSSGTNASLAGLTATGTDQTYHVHGTIAANQSGTCATSPATCNNAAATNRGRLVTVIY